MSHRSFYKRLKIGYNESHSGQKRGIPVKRCLLLLLCLLLLPSCAPAVEGDDSLHILATTYPVYLFTTAVTQDVEGVEVSLLVNSQTSCLHDYTLTVSDMKAIEGADIIVMNGVGLEDFMADALAQSEAAVIDCSADIDLLLTLEHAGHDGHDHAEAYDPHIWMDPHRAGQMVEAVTQGLSRLDPDHAHRYGDNRDAALSSLASVDPFYRDMVFPPYELITFHDGFQYFAQAQGFALLKAIEEQEGATASAAEIREISELIEAHDIPAIFTEKNGSSATAEAISRETGCGVYELDMLMSGEGTGIQPYLDAISANLETIVEALK